ncbi:MAG TPA: glycosyltransferase family 10, partial [Prolixibacteraceae bacterium]
DPILRFDDLYQRRLSAIRYFSKRPGFRLFGTGWEQPHGLDWESFRAAHLAGANPVENKLVEMGNYRFNLCIENCSFPGYITEKLFDSIFAGCIPVYLGAPDITNYVPPEVFINIKDFNSWADLERYMRSMSEKNAAGYLDAANSYISGNEFDKFHIDHLDGLLMGIICEEIDRLKVIRY